MKTFLIVLDSLGAGALPDAAEFGDAGANTLKSISRSTRFSIPNLLSLGLGNIEGLSFLCSSPAPQAAFGRLMERSRGKDSTVGHWEIAGIISKNRCRYSRKGFQRQCWMRLHCRLAEKFYVTARIREPM